MKNNQNFQNFQGMGPEIRILLLGGIFPENVKKHVFSHISIKNNAIAVFKGIIER